MTIAVKKTIPSTILGTCSLTALKPTVITMLTMTTKLTKVKSDKQNKINGLTTSLKR